MLTEKDYCDYDTCVALKKLGFSEKCPTYYDIEDNVGLLYNTQWALDNTPYQFTDCLESHNAYEDNSYVDAPTMWEAQKWLREEKNIIVEVFVDDDSDTPITYNIYKDGKCVYHHHGKYWSVKGWSEALSEGIKEAVKILKEK
jgi:hypothetical protein